MFKFSFRYSSSLGSNSHLFLLINRFFGKIGKLFSFVAADLVDKFNNLEKCLAQDKNNNYATIQSAIDYEKKHEIYMENQNATLSILRLIRGLEFISKLLENMHNNMDSNKKMPELAWQVYNQTLAHRHGWPVRQLAKAGFYLLPKKHDLFQIMLIGADPNNDKKENDTLFQDFTKSLDKVYSLIHKIYDENDFCELVLT